MSNSKSLAESGPAGFRQCPATFSRGNYLGSFAGRDQHVNEANGPSDSVQRHQRRASRSLSTSAKQTAESGNQKMLQMVNAMAEIKKSG